ncbi:MAG: hypothetical protein PHQ23_03505 [Candidatus Wallbacteria bacterium]|nr:hypothetical protein [Candidatus Wallbacteria bacterium]
MIKIITLLALILFVSMSSAGDSMPPDFNIQFYLGPVSINGVDAPVGTKIVAYDTEKSILGEATITEMGILKPMAVSEPEEGQSVIFEINGQLAFVFCGATEWIAPKAYAMITIGLGVPDTTPPKLTVYKLLTPTEILLEFDSTLAQEKVLDFNNYLVWEGTVRKTIRKSKCIRNDSVLLEIDPPVGNPNICFIKIRGIEDLRGNEMEPYEFYLCR